MQSFRKIVRASFEIVSGTGDLDVVYFHQLGAGPYPRLRAKSPSKRRGHLAEDCGCRWSGFVIRRRRACLGMPTDGGRWYECVELTKTVSC